MKLDYPKTAFIDISTKILITLTMYKLKKLEISYDEINKVSGMITKILKENNVSGFCALTNDGLRNLLIEDDRFCDNKHSVEFTGNYKDILEIISFLDYQLIEVVKEIK